MRARDCSSAPSAVMSAACRITPSWFGRSSQMSSPGRITRKPISTILVTVLVIAATEKELVGVDGAVCGIGPVDAAAATARILAERKPTEVLHDGLAGANG